MHILSSTGTEKQQTLCEHKKELQISLICTAASKLKWSHEWKTELFLSPFKDESRSVQSFICFEVIALQPWLIEVFHETGAVF